MYIDNIDSTMILHTMRMYQKQSKHFVFLKYKILWKTSIYVIYTIKKETHSKFL